MDLAKGTFIEEIIPFWRWILTPIFSFFGASLFRIIYPFLLSLVFSTDSLTFSFLSAVGTDGFSMFLMVYLAALTAPKYQFFVGLLVAISFSILGGISLTLYSADLLTFLASVIGILIAMFQIHEGTKQKI